MRRVAVLTALCFGCATTRPPSELPVPLAGDPPARVALAEPELELWMEGTQTPDPAESADALARSRSALGEALAGRGLEGVDSPDALLVVRARAVARTDGRRQAQIWSVVGVVFVVAIVVTAIVLSRDHSSSRRAGPFAAPSRSGRVAPGPWRGRPYYPAPSPFFFGWSVGVHVGIPLAAAPPPGPPPAAGEPSPMGAPVPDPLLDSRGWLDSDEVELVAELVDPASGTVRWRRAIRDGADPRDPGAMTQLVDRLLEGESFGRRGAEPPAPRTPSTVPQSHFGSPEDGASPAPATPSGPGPGSDL